MLLEAFLLQIDINLESARKFVHKAERFGKLFTGLGDSTFLIALQKFISYIIESLCRLFQSPN